MDKETLIKKLQGFKSNSIILELAYNIYDIKNVYRRGNDIIIEGTLKYKPE